MLACFAPEGVYNAPGADHLRGASIGEFAQGFFEAFPDSVYEWSVAVAGEDAVAVDWTFSGTMTGSLFDIPPMGGVASARGAHLIRVVGDRFSSVEAFWDNQQFFEQLGIKI